MTAIIGSVALIYVWKIYPVNLKVLVRKKINIKHCKSALSVVLEEFHNKVFVRRIIETIYKHC